MPREKPDDKGDRRQTLLADSGTPFRGGSGGGWVVVSFIGPAGVDVTELAVRMLRGSTALSAPLSQAGTTPTEANSGTEKSASAKTAGAKKGSRKK